MIYLDNSATTFPKPTEVYDFMYSFYKNHGVSPGRSGFDAAIETSQLVDNTRKMLTSLFNGGDDFNRLTFSNNATDSLNIILQGLINEGDHVITTELEHNSVLRPLYALSSQGKCEVSYISFNDEGFVEIDKIQKAIKSNTKVIVCTHCSNVIGTIQPIAEIGKLCRANNLIFIVDGSQSAGILDVNMIRDNIDVFIFTGHKCLMGPTGIGGSYVRENVNIKHTRFGGTGVRSAQLTHLYEYPYRLEAGTLNLLGISGLYAGVKWILDKGINKLHDQEMELWQILRDELAKIKGVTLYCADNIKNHNPVLSFNISGFEAAQVSEFLDMDYEIACRTGLQCAPKVHQRIGTYDKHGTVRLSLGPFNTKEHVDIAINAISDIAAIKNN